MRARVLSISSCASTRFFRSLLNIARLSRISVIVKSPAFVFGFNRPVLGLSFACVLYKSSTQGSTKTNPRSFYVV